jgi:hypothetical protein
MTSDLLYLPRQFRCGLRWYVPPLPLGGERGSILELRGENGEQSADTVLSLDVVFLVHGHTKLHAALEVHMQHLQSVQIGLDLLREQSVVGPVSRWVVYPACSRPGR